MTVFVLIIVLDFWLYVRKERIIDEADELDNLE
jgi:hypothetical protein